MAFYAPDHPGYWSLWNQGVETPWTDRAAVVGEGGVIVCDDRDEACQQHAENWSSDLEILQVAKSSRGFHFQPQRYIVYWVAPLVAARML